MECRLEQRTIAKDSQDPRRAAQTGHQDRPIDGRNIYAAETR
jgi:hypothetical protein